MVKKTTAMPTITEKKIVNPSSRKKTKSYSAAKFDAAGGENGLFVSMESTPGA
jgi:hypothetical protein